MADENKPHFTVHCVGKREGREFWTRVGVAWKNPKATDTISLVLNEGVSIAGKVVLLPYVEQEDKTADEKPAKAKRSDKATST